ncbi:hypothetical protein BHE74_00046457 [Ensete ventricosum]|nr:hypothetical protein BHE74_00046457 [Ensete ventricosum]
MGNRISMVSRKYVMVINFTKSRFDRFFVHRLVISKYWPFPTYQPMGSHTSTIL